MIDIIKNFIEAIKKMLSKETKQDINGIDWAILLAQLKRHEGLKLKMYKCSADYWTIGYGHNLEANGISNKIAELLLEEDSEKVEIQLKKLDWYNNLSNTRKSVIINMGFQMGVNGVKKFKNMISAIENQDFIKASEEMLNSRWHKETPKRCEELAEQMLTDKFKYV